MTDAEKIAYDVRPTTDGLVEMTFYRDSDGVEIFRMQVLPKHARKTAEKLTLASFKAEDECIRGDGT